MKVSYQYHFLKECFSNFVIFLAHYAPIPKKQIDTLINDKDVMDCKNTIILQVSGTPYNLVTKNSRYEKETALTNRVTKKIAQN